MRVAYLCHRIPYPPNKGDKIRAFHQIRALSAHHDIDLFTLADDPSDLQFQSALLEFCREVHVVAIDPRLQKLKSLPYLLTRQPLTLPYFHSPDLAAAVRSRMGERTYDRVFVYCSAMFQYVQKTGSIPVVTDLVDVDSDKWKQYGARSRFPFAAVYAREGSRLEDYEREVCRRSASVVVTTDREAQLVRSICAEANVHTVPNGVDTEYFRRSGGSAAGPPTIIFTGDMSYFPNEDAVVFFAGEVLPHIRRSVPDARFLVVGRNPGPNVVQLSRVPGVEVTGFVPDIRTYLAKAQVAVAPFSIAAGIQNKILEAMAFELPVVATPRAVQGLALEAAEMVATAPDAAGLAAHIIPFLNDGALARRTGEESRRRVSRCYNWDACLQQFLDLVENPARRQAHGSTA